MKTLGKMALAAALVMAGFGTADAVQQNADDLYQHHSNAYLSSNGNNNDKTAAIQGLEQARQQYLNENNLTRAAYCEFEKHSLRYEMNPTEETFEGLNAKALAYLNFQTLSINNRGSICVKMKSVCEGADEEHHLVGASEKKQFWTNKINHLTQQQ